MRPEAVEALPIAVGVPGCLSQEARIEPLGPLEHHSSRSGSSVLVAVKAALRPEAAKALPIAVWFQASEWFGREQHANPSYRSVNQASPRLAFMEWAVYCAPHGTPAQ